jgi:uroporphyrinogen III methyltransferase / synthase
MVELIVCWGSKGEALTADDPRALAGRRIVITRAPEQSEELLRRLAELGAEVLTLPMVRFVEPKETGELDGAIRSLAEFDWLVFTSANAVRFFLGRCREVRVWPLPAGLRMAVVGPATRAALETEGLRAALVPREFRGDALAAELGNEVDGRRVLLPRSDRAGDELPRVLRVAGATVTEVVAYRTAEPESLDATVLELLRRGDADALTFFSPSSFRHFAEAFGGDAARRLSARVAFAAVGPVTAAAIRDAGLPVAVEAPEATASAFVAALERHFHSRVARRGGS